MLENIAKALTRHLLQDEPGIGAREVSERVAAFVEALTWRDAALGSLNPQILVRICSAKRRISGRKQFALLRLLAATRLDICIN
jgi:hypothetical protein